MREKHGLESDNFLTEGGDLRRQLVVFGGEHLHFALQVGEPLLLALTALESGDTVK